MEESNNSAELELISPAGETRSSSKRSDCGTVDLHAARNAMAIMGKILRNLIFSFHQIAVRNNCG